MKYVCQICGYVYDEEREKTKFSDLPDSWTCPLCGAEKTNFKPEREEAEAADTKNEEASPAIMREAEPDMKQLSFGELSVLCSNLARGCEKQYMPEEAKLYSELAEYFRRAEPKPEAADMEKLSALIEDDLKNGYPELIGRAESDLDRGTLRICAWGGKVTRILDALVKRYNREGERLLYDTNVWVCTVCGFIYIGDAAPELCPVCKVPSWKFEKTEGRN